MTMLSRIYLGFFGSLCCSSKAKSAHLQSERILPFSLHGSMLIIGSIVGLMMYMPDDSPFIS